MLDDPGVARVRRSPRHWFAIGGVVALVVGGISAGLLINRPQSASAANLDILQCNGVSNAGGLTVACDVVVVNTLTDDAGTTGSVVTINGGAPVTSGDIVTSVNQCNGSANGGGGTVQCSVTITNNIAQLGPSAAVAATVNQCNDNQASDGLSNAPNTCDPFPASTSGATITQCNGTGNGGGLVNVEPLFSHCTASGTVSADLPVTVNQCNGSANGGGGQVSCRVSITTIVTDTTPGPTTPGPTTPGPTTPGPTTPGPTTPGPTTPGPTTPGPTTPGATTPAGATPGPTTPGATTPAGATPGPTTPGATTPAGATPGGITPAGATTPGGTTPTTTPGESIDLTQVSTPPRFTG